MQLEHLRTLPVIASRISSGRGRLHGWMYEIDSGEVFDYESEIGPFVKLGEPATDGRPRVAAGGRKP